MLETRTGNLLKANVEALVNTVNCEGVMGKGIALQFKQAYPDAFKTYYAACKSGEMQLGKVQIIFLSQMEYPRFIINFPTKGHWKSRSRIADIEAGLDDLVRAIKEHDIHSIALPPLGCGNGGLSWSEVKPLIERKLSMLENVNIQVFPPSGAPIAEQMPIGTKSPNMTPVKSVLLTMMGGYRRIDYDTEINQLVIQKLCYFLQVLGEPLQLNYERGAYGPYADNLKFVLQQLEGHYTRGYGDRSAPGAMIKILPGALEKAEQVSKKSPESIERIYSVLQLVDGFHSPYLLELLSTVHWVCTENSQVAKSPESVKAAVGEWSKRKKELFTLEDVKLAWEHLLAFKLIPSN